MAACVFDGNTDMYGLGIRLGFYLQWFSAILARFLVPKQSRHHRIEDPLKDEARGLRFSINIFAAATFLALLILIIGDLNSLQIVEIYIVLLLMFGYSLALVPIYLWRILTLCSPRWDPTRWPITRPSKVESRLTFLLVIGVASFQLWFWFARVPQLNNLSCEEYGFLMTKLPLNHPAMQAINILLFFLVLISCITVTVVSIVKEAGFLSKRRRRPRVKPVRKTVLQNLNIFFGLAVAAVVITATELTIKWNNIEGVNTLASAGQTIPFAIGAAAFIRILYVYFFKYPDSDDDEQYPPAPHVGGTDSPISGTDFPPVHLKPDRPSPRPPSHNDGTERPMSATAFPVMEAEPASRRWNREGSAAGTNA